jgi:hypothetical protein
MMSSKSLPQDDILTDPRPVVLSKITFRPARLEGLETIFLHFYIRLCNDDQQILTTYHLELLNDFSFQSDDHIALYCSVNALWAEKRSLPIDELGKYFNALKRRLSVYLKPYPEGVHLEEKQDIIMPHIFFLLEKFLEKGAKPSEDFLNKFPKIFACKNQYIAKLSLLSLRSQWLSCEENNMDLEGLKKLALDEESGGLYDIENLRSYTRSRDSHLSEKANDLYNIWFSKDGNNFDLDSLKELAKGCNVLLIKAWLSKEGNNFDYKTLREFIGEGPQKKYFLSSDNKLFRVDKSVDDKFPYVEVNPGERSLISVSLTKSIMWQFN